MKILQLNFVLFIEGVLVKSWYFWRYLKYKECFLEML
jgi:hypothetical protein